MVDIKQQNKQLLSSVDEYLASEQMDASEKNATRKTVSEYYKEKLDAGEDIQLKELADKLPKEPEGDDFYQFVANSETPIEETFQADRSALKTLAKFSGQGAVLVWVSSVIYMVNECIMMRAQTRWWLRVFRQIWKISC